jgi:ankyrin repeat protein
MNATVTGPGQTPLLNAAISGHRAVVKLLVDKGADLGAKDKNRLTLLLYAANNGHRAVVKLLLETKDKAG